MDREACWDNEMPCTAAACAKVSAIGRVPVIHVNDEGEKVLIGSSKKECQFVHISTAKGNL